MVLSHHELAANRSTIRAQNGARRLNCLPGPLEFHLLHAIRGENRDRLALQFTCHIVLSSLVSLPPGS
jgi:hypothetical protein